MARPFRHTAGFGKRIEYWIIGKMLKEGLDVYVPLVDDDAIDAVIRRPDGSFVAAQIKARSKNVVVGHAAPFAAISLEPVSVLTFDTGFRRFPVERFEHRQCRQDFGGVAGQQWRNGQLEAREDAAVQHA